MSAASSQKSTRVSHYSIDVECVATGIDHNSRSVAQVAVVVSGILRTATTLSQQATSCDSVKCRMIWSK